MNTGEFDTSLYVEGFCAGYNQKETDIIKLINYELDVLQRKNYSGVALYDFARNIRKIAKSAAGCD